MKKKTKTIILTVIAALLLIFLYYYIALPAINIHSPGLWGFLIFVAAVITFLIGIRTANRLHTDSSGDGIHFSFHGPIFKNKKFKISFLVTLALVLVYIIGSILSSQIVNASKYQKLISVEQRNFTEDIKEISYNEIPLLDSDSAALVGSRKMGSMVEYVSQFEVSKNYTQINYQETPYRIAPLEYGNIFKWLGNRKNGIPAYMRIDMATQTAECVKLTEGIKYSESEPLNRNIYRYLRFHFPTYIFDTINFEIDENGTPYWICPVKDYTIGLFGGVKIKNVVMVNAVTGEIENYNVEDVPTWVDRVYSAELLISYYDYYGSLKHGYFNTLFSMKDCLKTTAGYNYIALNDDVWVYTGVTSVGGDQSNVGFVLMNSRTAETRYYEIPGAEEFSAMNSAQGQVQNLGYVATFPLLLNISDEPTYFISLKDEAGLVKKYAMVNISKYSIVAIGDSVIECEKSYIQLLKNNNIQISEDSVTSKTASGVIAKIAPAVIEGNSHYYLMLEGSDEIFDVVVASNLEIIRFSEGDYINLTYNPGEKSNTVLTVK